MAEEKKAVDVVDVELGVEEEEKEIANAANHSENDGEEDDGGEDDACAVSVYGPKTHPHFYLAAADKAQHLCWKYVHRMSELHPLYSSASPLITHVCCMSTNKVDKNGAALVCGRLLAVSQKKSVAGKPPVFINGSPVAHLNQMHKLHPDWRSVFKVSADVKVNAVHTRRKRWRRNRWYGVW